MLSDHVAGVLEHKRQVAFLLHAVSAELNRRAIEHDNSKFSPEELSSFEQVAPRLKTLTYGSEEYRAAFREIKPAIQHHYQANRHHPEHFEQGIAGMNLVDLVEMLCDWVAASKRVKDGNVVRDLPLNQERFHIENQLFTIIENTIHLLLVDTPPT